METQRLARQMFLSGQKINILEVELFARADTLNNVNFDHPKYNRAIFP